LVFRLHNKRITSVEVIDFLKQLLRQHPGRHGNRRLKGTHIGA
jgi:hypothetical protein